MALRVVGAGLPRTGTTSLKATLEQLLGGSCYHMFELMERVEDDGARWWAALHGELERLDDLLADWVAAVDWPASLLWRELTERHPDALVILSHRGDSATWWASADATVWATMRRNETNDNEMIREFNRTMRASAGLGDDWANESAARAWYDRHFDEVVDSIPADRLLIWQPSDGFGPIAERLGMPAPDGPAVHANTRADFRERAGLDEA